MKLSIIKKFLVIALSFSFVVLMSCPQNVTYAYENKEQILEKKNEPKAVGDLTLSIYAAIDTNGTSSSGLAGQHAWIVVKNTGAGKTIGNYTLGHNGSITIGTWGNTKPKGIWYNLERQRHTGFQNNNKTVYYKTSISPSQAGTLSSYVKNHNIWTPTNNCVSFAVGAWNSVSSTKFSITTLTPSTLRNQIMKKSGYGTGRLEADFINASTVSREY